jgi:hypothetical protein
VQCRICLTVHLANNTFEYFVFKADMLKKCKECSVYAIVLFSNDTC